MKYWVGTNGKAWGCSSFSLPSHFLFTSSLRLQQQPLQLAISVLEEILPLFWKSVWRELRLVPSLCEGQRWTQNCFPESLHRNGVSIALHQEKGRLCFKQSRYEIVLLGSLIYYSFTCLYVATISYHQARAVVEQKDDDEESAQESVQELPQELPQELAQESVQESVQEEQKDLSMSMNDVPMTAQEKLTLYEIMKTMTSEEHETTLRIMGYDDSEEEVHIDLDSMDNCVLRQLQAFAKTLKPKDKWTCFIWWGWMLQLSVIRPIHVLALLATIIHFCFEIYQIDVCFIKERLTFWSLPIQTTVQRCWRLCWVYSRLQAPLCLHQKVSLPTLLHNDRFPPPVSEWWPYPTKGRSGLVPPPLVYPHQIHENLHHITLWYQHTGYERAHRDSAHPNTVPPSWVAKDHTIVKGDVYHSLWMIPLVCTVLLHRHKPIWCMP